MCHIDWLFWFLCSTQCCLIAFYPQENFFQSWSQSSSSGINSISRKHFLCSSLRSNSSSIQILSWDCSNLVTASGSISNSSSPAISLVFVISSYFLHWSLEPLKVIHEGWNQLLPNSYSCWYFDLFPWMVLMASKVVTPFLKVFNLLCPDPSEESLSMAAVALWNVFLK